MRSKHLIGIYDFDQAEIKTIFELARKIKKNPSAYQDYLKGRVAALVFEKPSTRTRVSFEAGFKALGGQTIYLGPGDIQMGVREEIRDMARSLSRYLDLVILRTFSHEVILEFARYFNKLVVNGLSNLEHPCQALSDIFTINETFGSLHGKKIAYVGDGNNVCHSLLLLAARLGLHFSFATPADYRPHAAILTAAKKEAARTKSKIESFTHPEAAVRGADIIYTDVWVSMGQEKETENRRKVFQEFQVNAKLVSKAKKTVRIMHCLPAHRGEEITNECLEGKQSIVFEQAENRLHVQKAILIYLFGANLNRQYRSVNN